MLDILRGLPWSPALSGRWWPKPPARSRQSQSTWLQAGAGGEQGVGLHLVLQLHNTLTHAHPRAHPATRRHAGCRPSHWAPHLPAPNLTGRLTCLPPISQGAPPACPISPGASPACPMSLGASPACPTPPFRPPSPSPLPLNGRLTCLPHLLNCGQRQPISLPPTQPSLPRTQGPHLPAPPPLELWAAPARRQSWRRSW